MTFDWFPEISRILSAIAFAVYGLVLMTTIPNATYKVALHTLMLIAFGTSGVILFNSVIFKLPGWPAMMVAIFILALSVATFNYTRKVFADRGLTDG